MFEELVTINDEDYPKSQAGSIIDALNAAGKSARVQYADGALWLYHANGRCSKLNDM